MEFTRGTEIVRSWMQIFDTVMEAFDGRGTPASVRIGTTFPEEEVKLVRLPECWRGPRFHASVESPAGTARCHLGFWIFPQISRVP